MNGFRQIEQAAREAREKWSRLHPENMGKKDFYAIRAAALDLARQMEAAADQAADALERISRLEKELDEERDRWRAATQRLDALAALKGL